MRDVHTCHLRKNRSSDSGFIKLRPNATILQILQVKIKLLLMLDMTNWNSQEYFPTQSMMRSELRRHLSGPCYIIHPFSKFNTFFEFLTFIIWLFRYGIFMVRWHRVFIIINPLLQFIQAIFILYHFFLGYVDYNKREIVIGLRQIAWYYIRTYFIIDMFVIFCDATTADNVNNGYNIAKVIAYVFAIIMRFPHNHKRLRDILLHFQVHRAIIFFVCHSFVLTFMLHFLTMIFILIPTFIHGNDQPVDGWIYNCAHTKSVIYETFGIIYSHGFLIITCNFFGIGHQYYPRKPEENVFLTFVCVFGRLYTLVLLSNVLEIFGYPDISQSEYEKLLNELREYSISRNLPKILYEKLKMLFEYKLQKSYFNEKEILSTLTEQLKADVFLYGARKLIARVETFKTLPNTALAELFSHMNSRVYLPNEVIRNSDDALESVYFVSSGCVALYLNGVWEISHFNDGDEFGMIKLFYNVRDDEHLTYVAVESTEIYTIRKRHLLAYFTKYPEVEKFFGERAKERAAMITNRKKVLGKVGLDLLSQMKAGTILEEPRLRPFELN
ncbi:unnamed protein product [Phaedon cochleariae]|uniref:Cyclic nucleotide-binding domain-containing protein n=1 Tax=Phaedon cochleariae TaxID=80249 RepID=A0A9P0DX38_PHACE|nr:unnamed protein product [Phaedon cochleariae]